MTKDNVISVDSIEAKLGSARLLADIGAAEALMKLERNQEAVLKLAPMCLNKKDDTLDRTCQTRALTIFKVCAIVTNIFGLLTGGIAAHTSMSIQARDPWIILAIQALHQYNTDTEIQSERLKMLAECFGCAQRQEAQQARSLQPPALLVAQS